MKHKKLIIGAVLPLIVVVVIVFIYFMENAVYINTRFADKVMLQVEPRYSKERTPIITEINQDDAEILKKIFVDIAIKDTPACLFGSVNLVFESAYKSVTLYPACDDCDTVRILHNGQDYYFYLGDNNKRLMREILIKYGVVWRT